VNFNCFDLKPSIKEFMKKNGMTTYQQLLNYYLKRVRTLTPKKRAIYWLYNELNTQYDKNDIVQIWSTSSQIPKILKQLNNSVILSPHDKWYLDCGFGNYYGNKSWCDPYKTWRTIYEFEPTENVEDKEKILGGEVCMWSELVDSYSMDNKIWPRAAALNLWSPFEKQKNILDVLHRLSAHSKRLQQRGIHASTILDTYCIKHPDMCPLPLPK